ncbi:hypothetical protein BAUCODRAFT_545010 [Baudoinia panamericana UAMH 10762]|uniref:Uncharacterized protein n=1 Tax=Baudoinia panamericana (strain UAMH 10762) TaxID=717646 RepID=M2N6D8_BAUPA|nr:uncharacterized protein BAUCODRAFT_545010 [Baudoinia panamericana UAMH 10762]EMC94345.1 hypothetical protein BAUCODRAFT_545010 [Baudoinia panamericana UAMH 10762]
MALATNCKVESTHIVSNLIRFLSAGMPSTWTSMTSPLSKKVFGSRKYPTPAGVPVMTAVKAGIVVPVLVQLYSNDLHGHTPYLGSYGSVSALG